MTSRKDLQDSTTNKLQVTNIFLCIDVYDQALITSKRPANNQSLMEISQWSGLAWLIVHCTLGQGVPGSIPNQGSVCCGLEQVTVPQLNVYTV